VSVRQGIQRFLVLGLLLCFSAAVPAHRPSDAFLTLEIDGTALTGQWEIAARDIEALIEVDSDHDRRLSWGELRGGADALAQAALASLDLSNGDSPCQLGVTDLLVNPRSDGNYAWLSLAGHCARPPDRLTIRYRLLGNVDPTHRGLLVLKAGADTQTAVLQPDGTARVFGIAGVDAVSTVIDYLRDGVHHIWIGTDHILFLLSLLLPSVLRYSQGRWQPVATLRAALIEVIAVVTSFTAAHSITLTLSALAIVQLPGLWVESAIAASVIAAALNNVRPVVTRRRWALAFGFGLIHGFGFASVLGELGLPPGQRLTALLSFNLGVEIGQLAIVAGIVPLAYALRRGAFYRSGVRVGGSLMIAAFGSYWLLQRVGVLPG
jgi:hypothetical protein